MYLFIHIYINLIHLKEDLTHYSYKQSSRTLITLPKNVYIHFFFEFRTDNHKHPIETGRWDDIRHKERLVLYVILTLVTNFIIGSHAPLLKMSEKCI